jgi:gamma-glutamyltranspeptidase/glutathione hydrolase
MLLQLLGSFDRADLAAQDPTTSQGAHVLAETIRASVGDRMKHVGDPAFGGHALDGLLAPARLKARRAAIKSDTSRAPSAFIAEDHGTSHLVVTDAEGNIVSLTTTINGPFGSRVFAEGPGILLNDEMDDFTRRYRAAEVGVVDPPGVMKPGARPPSSMTPTLVMKNGAPVLVIGGSGGMRIATGVSLVTAAVLGRGVALPQAVAQSRLHVSVSGDLLVEPGALDANVRRALTSAGERVREEPNISAVQGVSWKDGKVEAASDPRKFGVASVHAAK